MHRPRFMPLMWRPIKRRLQAAPHSEPRDGHGADHIESLEIPFLSDASQWPLEIARGPAHCARAPAHPKRTHPRKCQSPGERGPSFGPSADGRCGDQTPRWGVSHSTNVRRSRLAAKSRKHRRTRATPSQPDLSGTSKARALGQDPADAADATATDSGVASRRAPSRTTAVRGVDRQRPSIMRKQGKRPWGRRLERTASSPTPPSTRAAASSQDAWQADGVKKAIHNRPHVMRNAATRTLN